MSCQCEENPLSTTEKTVLYVGGYLVTAAALYYILKPKTASATPAPENIPVNTPTTGSVLNPIDITQWEPAVVFDTNQIYEVVSIIPLNSISPATPGSQLTKDQLKTFVENSNWSNVSILFSPGDDLNLWNFGIPKPNTYLANQAIVFIGTWTGPINYPISTNKTALRWKGTNTGVFRGLPQGTVGAPVFTGFNRSGGFNRGGFNFGNRFFPRFNISPWWNNYYFPRNYTPFPLLSYNYVRDYYPTTNFQLNVNDLGQWAYDASNVFRSNQVYEVLTNISGIETRNQLQSMLTARGWSDPNIVWMSGDDPNLWPKNLTRLDADRMHTSVVFVGKWSGLDNTPIDPNMTVLRWIGNNYSGYRFNIPYLFSRNVVFR